MSTVTDELLLRIAVLGGAVAASEVAAFDERIAMAEATVGRATPKFKGLASVFGSFKAMAAGFTLVAAVKQFSNFERQMKMLQTQTGASASEVRKATKAILGMSVSLATGPNGLAQSLYHIESTQKRGTQAYKEMRVAAEGAKIGNADLVDVTNALNAVVVGKLLPGTNAFNKAMGQLNATVGSGDMYMQDLASAYSTGILKSLGQVGLKLIDVNAAMAVLGDNNIRGTQAANRLRMGLLQVVDPTSKAAANLHTLHMTTYQLAADFYKPRGLYVALKDMNDHLNKLGDTTKGKIAANAILMSLFGRGRMSAGVLTLDSEMGRLASKYDAINKGQADFNQAWEEYKQTLSYTIDQLKALGEVVLIKVGHEVKNIVNWFRKAGPLAKTIEDIALAWLAVYSAIKLARGAMILFNLAADLNPYTMALAGIIVILVALVRHFGGVRQTMRAFKTFAQHVWYDLEVIFAQGVNNIIRSIDHMIDAWNAIAGVKIFGFQPIGKTQIGRIPLVDMPVAPWAWKPSSAAQAWPNGVHAVLPPTHPAAPQGTERTMPGWESYNQIIQKMMAGGRDVNVNVYLDGKQIAKSVTRQGAMAQARRGVGGPTIAQTGG